MPLQRKHETVSARAQTLIEIRANKTSNLPPRRLEIINEHLVLRSRTLRRIRDQIRSEVVAWQLKISKRIKCSRVCHFRRGIIVIKDVIHRDRFTLREGKTTRNRTIRILKLQILSASVILLGVRVQDEATGPSHKVLTHQTLPVLRLLRLPKRSQSRMRHLQILIEIRIAIQREFRSKPEIL